MISQGKNGIDVVLAESLKELAKTRPIDKITIKEITDKAGVIRPTFYNHFQDKYELLEWIVEEELLNPAIPLFQNGMTREGMTYILTTIEKEKEFYEKASRLEGQNSFKEILFVNIQKLVLKQLDIEKVKSKYNYEWLTPENIANYYTYNLCTMIFQWIEGGMGIPISEVVDVIIGLSKEAMTDNML